MSHKFEDIAPEGAYLKNPPFASIKKKSFDTSWYKIEEKLYTNFSTLLQRNLPHKVIKNRQFLQPSL